MYSFLVLIEAIASAPNIEIDVREIAAYGAMFAFVEIELDGSLAGRSAPKPGRRAKS
jgi:hypothetical protein